MNLREVMRQELEVQDNGFTFDVLNALPPPKPLRQRNYNLVVTVPLLTAASGTIAWFQPQVMQAAGWWTIPSAGLIVAGLALVMAFVEEPA